jgi:aminopeptidase N
MGPTRIRIARLAACVALAFGAGTCCPPKAETTTPVVKPVAAVPDAAPVATPEPDPAPPGLRLPGDVVATRCALDLTIVPDQPRFTGSMAIQARVVQPTRVVWLNATGLTITGASLGGEPARLIGTVEGVVPETADFVGLTLDRELEVGPLSIAVDYSAAIDRTKSQGVYAVEEAGQWYAYTFFEPIDGRRAFPGFDQPDAKLPWRLTFHVKTNHVALANAPVETEVDEGNGMKRVVLAESRPMPSYLVAFMVGPFDVVDGGKGGRIDTPIRFIVPPGHRDELTYAKSITPAVVAALENYFDMDYPYIKLDVAVVPRFWGTMEHPGIVAMGQPLTLIKPSDDSRAKRQAYTNILAHELAHYWFGDLVTLAWWDDTWLNESLGTWMDAIITDAAEPSWKYRDSAIGRAFEALGADETLSTKSIRQPVDTKEGISSSFDGAITYYKGQTVLRMFESYVGANVWQEFIRAYVTKFAWKNATADDFLSTMTEMLGASTTDAFRTFLDQPGAPLVEHELKCDGAGARLALHQRRALPAGVTDATARTWQVPVCVRYGKGKTSHRSCTLLAAADGAIDLEGGCPTWITMNADGIGYYRSRYTAAEARALLGAKSPVSMPERMTVLGDLSAAVERDELGLGDAMALAPLVVSDPDDRLRASAWSLSGPLRADLFDDKLLAKYRKWVLATFGPTARKLGWRRKAGDSDDRQELRAALVGAVAYAGDKKLMAEAGKLARAWLADRSAIEDEIVRPAMGLATRNGDAALFDTILAAARAAKEDREHQQRLLFALGGFIDPALTKRALDLVLGTEFDLRESKNILWNVLYTRETRELGWAFVTEHVDELLARSRSDEAGWFIGGLAGFSCDTAHRDRAAALFESRVAALDGARYALDQGLEQSAQCIAAQARLAPSAAKFLSKY